jgi:hypothetical protein
MIGHLITALYHLAQRNGVNCNTCNPGCSITEIMLGNSFVIFSWIICCGIFNGAAEIYTARKNMTFLQYMYFS